MRPDPRAVWAGVDVGGDKGFDVAVVDDRGIVAGPSRLRGVSAVLRLLYEHRPLIVAVDSPRSPAPGNQLSREGERKLVRAGICGIRYTPNVDVLNAGNAYHGWIRNGLALFEALDDARDSAGWRSIECFPTATWSRLGGARGSMSRATWSREILVGLALEHLPTRMNQDARDPVGAAITARLFDEGRVEMFGDIAVPPLSQRGR
jgi:hypothetical protein